MNVSRDRAKKIYEELIKEGEKVKDENEFLKKNWEKVEHLSDNIGEIPRIITKKVFAETMDIINNLKKRFSDYVKET